MSFPLSLPYGGGGAPVNYLDWDFHTYARQSSTMSYGNANTGMQEEDLPDLLAQRFGVDRHAHPFFRCYQTEVESAADGSISIRRDHTKKGRLILDDFERTQLLEIFDTITDRWQRYRRPAVIGVTMLNRLGRSDWVLPMLSTYANQTEGNLWVYVASTGAMLNPANPTDQHTFVAEFSFSGKGENRTKQLAVLGARRRIGTQSGKSTRSLGERIYGYTKVFVDYSGEPLSDEQALDWVQRRSKQPPKALRRDDSCGPLIERVYNLLTVSNFRPSRISAIINSEFGDNPLTGRPWSAKTIRLMLSNPIYRGQRITDRTRALNLGNRKRRRASRPDELVISPSDESLRFISDEQWTLAQEMTTENNTSPEVVGRQVARSQRGRPMSVELLFHRTQILACAVCGASLNVHRFASSGKTTHYYRCGHRTTHWGQPRCQSHDAQVVDGAVTQYMMSLFSSLATLTENLRTEVKTLRLQSTMYLADKRIEALSAELKKLDSALLLVRLDVAAGKVSESQFERMQALVDAKAAELARLEEQRITNHSSIVLKTKENRLRQLEGMKAFELAPFADRVATLQSLVQHVWIWPDGSFDFQWHGQDDDQFQERVNKRLRIATDWPILDFNELSHQTIRLIDQGMIPFTMIDAGSGTGSLRRTMADIRSGKADSKRQTAAILRAYMRASRLYFDATAATERLRTEIRQRVGAGETLTTIAEALGVSRWAIARFLEDTPLQWTQLRRATEGAVNSWGWDRDTYFSLPDWAFTHPKLEEIGYVLRIDEKMDYHVNPCTTWQINEKSPTP